MTMRAPVRTVRLLESDGAVQEAETLNLRAERVRRAVAERNRGMGDPEIWYPIEVYPDFAIVRQNLNLYQVPYTIAADGVVTLGAGVRVEEEFVPVRVQEAAVLRLQAGEDAPTGTQWEVEIIRPGWSLNGIYYPAAALRASAHLFEGVHVYYFGDSASGHHTNPTQKVQAALAGWIEGVSAREDGAVVGTLHFLQGGVAEGVRTTLVDAWKRGKKDLIGLSIDAHGVVQAGTAEGRKGKLVESLSRVLSVDVVLKPAAGGRFTRLVASAAEPDQEKTMNWRKFLIRFLEARRPSALAGIDRDNATADELLGLMNDEELREAFAERQQQGAAAPNAQQPLQAAAGGGSTATDPAHAANVVMTRMVLREKLQESKLPDTVQRRLRQRLDGQVLTEEQIQASIDEERTYLAELNPARPNGLGTKDGNGTQAQVGPSKRERLQAALDKSFGLAVEDPALRSVRPIGLRELYNEITFGHDPNVSEGRLSESAVQAMLQEAFDSTTLPYMLGNTMHRAMLRDYRIPSFGEEFIYSRRPGGLRDFKQHEAIRLGYFGNLSNVDPESADYAELAAYGEERAPYSAGQKGNIVTVTRKHIINDDMGAVAKIPGRLGRAARRTFAEFVWAFATGNGAIFDTVAWFHATHANLGAAALSVTTLNAAELAMMDQTEPGSGKKIGLAPYVLAVPHGLKATAIAINQSPFLPGSANNDANPWYHRFGANNERIVVNPILSDANDWYLFADKAEGDIIEVGFLNDQEEPELFVADVPTEGQMFLADKLRFKIRHEYGGAVVDYRTAYKAVVA